MNLDYYYLQRLIDTHPAIRLLKSDNAAFVLSFLNNSFIETNRREIYHSDLVSYLDDYIYYLNDANEEPLFPRTASTYLNEWAHDEKGWIRKYYRQGSDDPCYDLTPAVEKVLSWISNLAKKQFVGTQSRLTMVFELLKTIAYGAETDVESRITRLEKERDEITREIEKLKRGELSVMDEANMRDSFLQMERTARDLLADFREVEQNFRQLDRNVREKITAWEGDKGSLLEEIFGDRDVIIDSDQGRTFTAFWDFLMNPAAQDDLGTLMDQVYSLEAIQKLQPDKRLKRIHYDWLEAGEHTQRTVASLSQQLRRYLDNQVYLENKRVMQILDSITQNALRLKGDEPDFQMEIENAAPGIAMPMERPLFSPPVEYDIDSLISAAEDDEIDISTLYNQVYVDKQKLKEKIHEELKGKSQVSLCEVIQKHPLEKGMAELVAYISIASESRFSVFDETVTETVSWLTEEGRARRARCVRILYSRI